MPPKNSNAPEWEYVKVLDASKANKYLECLLCGHKYYGSASRVRGHLLGIPDRGVTRCLKAPREVKVAPRAGARLHGAQGGLAGVGGV
ncbi:hypothetical protein HXX76_001823 [Chlamydomonas incerta]|uniref:BED-type domain-containing protein n=1 Tax=Chlamydomonas incerta TaxID=51695 RepID=A0A835TE64_CHLIN|nr:hypothetical protein HXX76_001823 [Chlamydomonas incerta]|eukprot:KAG2443468.1 hypothetical protein HXX76_001823 [Chlamydomonas incerta]